MRAKTVEYAKLAAVLAMLACATPSAADEMSADGRMELERTAANHHAYEFHSVEDTPPPDGYKPFYISHYGRHGSRRLIGGALPNTLKALKSAASDDSLTAEGAELLAEMRRLEEVHVWMTGELTERGAEEHRRLALRMAERFPDVFRDARRVRCRASGVGRVILSMQNFTIALKERFPALAFDFTAGEKYERLFCEPVFLKRSNAEFKSSINDAVDKVAADVLRPDGLARRIFASRDVVKDKARFMRDLFMCASDCQCVRAETGGLDLYRFFTADEIAGCARVFAADIYANMGNSAEFGDAFVNVTIPLAQDFLDRAEDAIADGRTAADLRFGHDNGIWPLAVLLGIEGPDARVPLVGAMTECPPWKWSPMAANLQIAFYRNAESDVLVKILYNEREMAVRGLEGAAGPYYSWDVFRDHVARRTRPWRVNGVPLK